MAAVPQHPETTDTSYNVLDSATPMLPNLVVRIAERLNTKAPRLIIPVGLIRRLPRAITTVEPEPLSFIASDRCSTESADGFTAATGLVMPDVGNVIDRWVDYLVHTDFLRSPSQSATKP